MIHKNTLVLDESDIFLLPDCQIYVFSRSPYVEYRRLCLNPLALLVALLAPDCQVMGLCQASLILEIWCKVQQ